MKTPIDRNTLPRRGLLLIALLLLLPQTASARDLLAPVRQVLTEREARIVEVSDPLYQADLLLETGWHDRAVALIPALLEAGEEGEIRAARVALAVRDFEHLGALIPRLDIENPESRALHYEWRFARQDLRSVDELVGDMLGQDSCSVTDLLAAGRLQRSLLNHDAARTLYERALVHASSPVDSAAALNGLARVAYKKRNFDDGLALLIRAIRLHPLEVDHLMMLSHTLIRLGRTEEAIDAIELVVRLAPEHDDGHYMLGNGYARKNYTQLQDAYPSVFADPVGGLLLAHADSLLDAGDAPGARSVYLTIHQEHPGWADVLVRIGSLDFGRADFASARARFKEALAICPEYGRAHNGLAKAIEGQRFAIEVHRPLYEEVFSSTPFPDVPQIEEFVVNWNALSERHKKRVALSVAPWSRFLPVLIEGGATYYIKPLYELLSETPGQENLRDLRISSDARLWDDVRGCGGYNSVTGIEDVERTIFYRYDTVVHELTHQVHGILPTARSRQLQELYRRTKEREIETGDEFLSRYAGSNVWEYFAEGTNALLSPRRDEYDTREIVRERLDEYDPTLVQLVQELMQEADVESCYAVAYVNLGYQSIEQGRPLDAIPVFRKALARSPGEENALGALVYALLLADSTQGALNVSEKAIALHPESGELATGHANAMWHAGRPMTDALAFLNASYDRVRADEQYRVDLAMGRYHWITGEADAAKKSFQAALAKRPEYPPALAGLAGALALAGERDEAWDTYDRAIRLRSGASDLREAFARDLLLAGEKELARVQIAESILLDPDNPRALALTGWMALVEQRPDSAKAIASSILETSPWCDLALLIKAQAEEAQGEIALAEATLRPWRERVERRSPPDYVYLPKWGRYDEVHTMPVVERRIASALPGDGASGANAGSAWGKKR